MNAQALLDDAYLLFERAQAHRREFGHITGVGPGLLWDVRHTVSADGAIHRAELVLDQAVLRRTKPVIADIANNLVHALDHILAAAQRQANTGKGGNIYFPFALDDKIYTDRIAELTPYIGEDWAKLIAAAREQHRLYLAYLKTLKTISNKAKHWELRPGIAGAHAVQWFGPQHGIKDIPAGHFAGEESFRFWEGAAAFSGGDVQVVTSFRIRGEEIDEIDLDPVVNTSAQFVVELLATAGEHLTGPAAQG